MCTSIQPTDKNTTLNKAYMDNMQIFLKKLEKLIKKTPTSVSQDCFFLKCKKLPNFIVSFFIIQKDCCCIDIFFTDDNYKLDLIIYYKGTKTKNYITKNS